MRSTLLMLAVIAPLIAGCGADLFTEELNFQIFTDTLDISIVRDETPGFAYPMMRHSVQFVGYMNVPGLIDHFSYQSQNVERSVVYDYFFNEPPTAGTRFRDSFVLWDKELLAAGMPIQYSYGAYGSGGINLVKNETVDVQVLIDSQRPVSNSMQLTGPERRNYRPLFTSDGQWIYHSGFDRNTNITSIHRISVDGSIQETLFESQENIGGITLIKNDAALLYTIWRPQQPTRIVERDLSTGNEKETIIEGSLWDSRLVAIPGTSQFISLMDPNTTDDDLALVDMETGVIEVLVSAQEVGRISSYDYRPGTSQVSFIARDFSDNTSVYVLDLNTRQREIYISDFEGYQLSWKPNGEDFAYVRFNELWDRNIFLREAGVDRQLTTYPGEDTDIAFSLDGSMIAFTARRRDDTQIWRLDL